MLSTSMELAVDHVVLADGSILDGKKLRGFLDITNSKCNFHRNETKKENFLLLNINLNFYQDLWRMMVYMRVELRVIDRFEMWINKIQIV